MLVALPFVAARAQDSSCSYLACGLRIAPVWNGLDVVRGAEGQRVSGLGFFWAKDVRPALAVNDSSAAYAARAVRVRRVAAVLTDAGALALAYAAGRQLHNGAFTSGDKGAAVAGATAFAVSVPLQFAADGLLSRSLWWFNSSLRR